MKNLILPSWYNLNDKNTNTADKAGKRNKTIHMARSALGSLGEALAIQLSGTHINKSWLSNIDPSAKTVGVLILIITVTIIHSLYALGIIFILSVLAAISAKIDKKQLLRIWLGVPFFSLFIILPSTLNLVSPGDVIIPIWHFDENAKIFGWELPNVVGITLSGITVSIRFLLRVVSCVTLASLLTATTNQTELINGLRRLGFPQIFGMVMSMMQRYLSIMLKAAEEIHLAKLSRTISRNTTKNEQKWVSAGIGSLFRRTHGLANEVYHAMISRGYNGDIKMMNTASIGKKDILLIIISVFIAAILIMFDRKLIA